jgi:hypothetical protein
MIMSGKLRDFVCNVIAKGQITLGDVRRLQRGYLPAGITNCEELEILIYLNATIIRADKAWAQWLPSVVADFVTTREAYEASFEYAAGKRVEHLLNTSATKLGRRIARQIRRDLGRLRAVHATRAEELKRCDPQQLTQVRAPEHKADDGSPRGDRGGEPAHCDADENLARSGPQRQTVGPGMIPRTTLTSVAQDLMNFQSSRVSLALAPCC